MPDSGGFHCEDELLNVLGRHFPAKHREVLLGRGDDCALLAQGAALCVSSDLFLEDVHFRRSYFSPEDVGYKALACNVSDIAACGARPAAFLLNIGVPPWVDTDWFEGFASEMGKAAARWGICLAGGDISRTASKLHISITVFGRTLGQGVFLSRGGFMPGDALFVVGAVGLARMGLTLLEERGRAAIEECPEACRAHLRPEPQVDAGLLLARAAMNARPPALMDISDGIARDLPRLLGLTGEDGAAGRASGSGLGAELFLDAGQLSQELVSWCSRTGRNPVHEAMLGGEDYALLGACAPDMLGVLRAAIPGFWQLGTVTDSGRCFLNGEPMERLRGFDHFQKEE